MTDPISRTSAARANLRDEDADAAQCKAPGAARSERASAAAASYADLARRSPEQRAPAGRPGGDAARTSEIVHPERTFTKPGPLAKEVLRLRSELARTADPALQKALASRIATLSTQWCAMARAAGMSPPPASFDPMRATDKELANAFLWVEVGNCYPNGSFAAPVDPDRFRDAIMTAMLVRTPGALDRSIAERPNDPRLPSLVQADLRRRGDTQCRPGDSLDALLARRATLIAHERANADAEAARTKYIGLDGRIGTEEELGRYEVEQYILALSPGTFTGSVLASASALRGGDVTDMRRAGALGNAVESVADGMKPRGHATIGSGEPVQDAPGRREHRQ